MRVKQYKMRSLTVEQGKETCVDVDLEFEGSRAFVVWDSITVGTAMFKARVEIDPALLLKEGGRTWDFFYRGELVLPRPQNN
jgi:hypothetical protein